MPFLNLSGLSLSGNLMIAPKVESAAGFLVSEMNYVTSTAKAFGFALDSDGTSLIVGAYTSAKTFIYDYNGVSWTPTIEITKSGRFGYKVAIDGEWAAVSNNPASGNGQIFIYRKVGGVWSATEHTILSNPDTALGAGYGSSVAIHNGTLVVGHRQASSVGGAHAYTFDGSAWVKQGGLITVPSASTRAGATQNLGIEVSIHNDIMVVGGPGDTLGKGLGIAIVSKRSGGTWGTPAVIKPATTFADGFGWSVDIRGTTVAVGAPNGNTAEDLPGRAFLYDVSGSTPSLTQIFTVKTNTSEIIQDPLKTNADTYGWAVNVSPDQNVLVVGSVGRNGNRGITYVYEKALGVWGKSKIPDSWLTTSNAAANHRFGAAFAFAQSGLLVGALGLGAFYWFK